jgi:uncharacterized protein (DUF58 family)
MALRLRSRLEAWARPRRAEALPVAIDRHRVYVLPTRFGLFFALMLLAMGLGALNYNNNPALLLALLLAGAANASLVAAHLQLSGLQVGAIGADPGPPGSPLRWRGQLRAPAGRERGGLRDDRGEAFDMVALDGGDGVATLAVPTERRGWLDPGRLRISTQRPLGLAKAWAYAWPETPLLVYPAPEAHGPSLPRSGDGAAARLDPAGDDVHHLRAYRRGDPRRAIAGKPSARRDALLVREYEQPQGSEVMLDWRALAPLDDEARIRRLARWVDEAERQGRRYRLLLPGQPPLGPDHGPRHRHACLRALALLPE